MPVCPNWIVLGGSDSDIPTVTKDCKACGYFSSFKAEASFLLGTPVVTTSLPRHILALTLSLELRGVTSMDFLVPLRVVIDLLKPHPHAPHSTERLRRARLYPWT